MCDEIINAKDSSSINVANTIAINFESPISISSDNEVLMKVRYEMNYYILQTFLLVIILLFIIAIICYDYAKHRLKQKILTH